MAEEKEEDERRSEKQERVEIKKTLLEYLGFLMKYKLIVLVVLFLVFFLEARHIAESYLFKVFVDKGTLFAAGTLLASELIRIILILLGIMGIIIITGFAGRWMQQHLVNV